MKTKAAIIIVLSLLCALGIALRPTTVRNRPTEQWLDTQVPQVIGNFTVLNNYKMDEMTYKTLNAYGIISRDMSDGSHTYDTVLIASDDKQSFHDPRVCFSAQFNEVLSETIVSVDSPVGKLPMTLLLLKNEQPGGGLNYAAYCYKGPGGYYAAPDGLAGNLFWKELFTGQIGEGSFYRFIDLGGGDGNDVKDAFLKFCGQYVAAVKKQSNGRF